MGAMTRHKAPKVVLGMKPIMKGRGPNDSGLLRLPERLRGMILYALKDAAEYLKKDVDNLVWRVDRNGTVHITDKEVKVQ